MDMENLTVLNRLAEGRLRYARALRLLERNAIRRQDERRRIARLLAAELVSLSEHQDHDRQPAPHLAERSALAG